MGLLSFHAAGLCGATCFRPASCLSPSNRDQEETLQVKTPGIWLAGSLFFSSRASGVREPFVSRMSGHKKWRQDQVFTWLSAGTLRTDVGHTHLVPMAPQALAARFLSSSKGLEEEPSTFQGDCDVSWKRDPGPGCGGFQGQGASHLHFQV